MSRVPFVLFAILASPALAMTLEPPTKQESQKMVGEALPQPTESLPAGRRQHGGEVQPDQVNHPAQNGKQPTKPVPGLQRSWP